MMTFYDFTDVQRYSQGRSQDAKNEETPSDRAPQAPRVWRVGCPLLIGKGSEEGALPFPRNFC